MRWSWPDLALLHDLVPNFIQLGGLFAVFAAGLVMLVLGRTMLGDRSLPEIALIAGWGLLSLVITVWGVATPADMRYPAIALIGIAAIATLTPRGRVTRGDLIAFGPIFIAGLPLLIVLASAYPTQPDTFTNQLPNAAYLYDYGMFPGQNRPPMLAVWPAFPYNLQIAAFLPTLLAPDYPPSILTHVNLLLQLAFALLLARAFRDPDIPALVPPSWPAAAGGILLASFFNPGFDPNIQFSGYGDPAIAVAVAFAAWQAERLLAACAKKDPGVEERFALALVLLAGVAIKQVSVMLMGAVVGTAFLIGAFDKRIGMIRSAAAFLPAFLPSLLLVGIWRFYVGSHFVPEDELRLMPFAEWNLGHIPEMFANMGVQIWERMPFFILLYGVGFAAIPMALRRFHLPVGRMVLLTGGVTLLYTGFLLFTYVAHFQGEIGISAHSFFRYNLHLSFLAMLTGVMLAREAWLVRGAPRLQGGWNFVQVGAVMLAIAAPLVTSNWIRFDRRQPQPLVWELARFAAPYFSNGDKIALLLPGDNRTAAFMLRVAITMVPPRRMLASFDDMKSADDAALEKARDNGNTYALISCAPPGLKVFDSGHVPVDVPAGRAALLLNDHGTWRLIATHAYPASLPPTDRWTSEVAPGPFCR